MQTSSPNVEALPSKARRAGLLLAALGLGLAPRLAGGCAAPFDPPSQVEGVRVLAVTADKPYARPGERVTFEMTAVDGRKDPEGAPLAPRPLQITWIGGCVDPPDDQYFGCFPQLAELLGGDLPPPGLVAQGVGLDTFSVELPEDIVSRREAPPGGPRYGVAFVFFAACAGQLRPVPPSGEGRAGDFPFGCFDEEGRRLGPESFVPGYTQVYAFEDGRTNGNPQATGMTLGGEPLAEPGPEGEGVPVVPRCPVGEEERRATGCAAEGAAEACEAVELAVRVPGEPGEIDAGATGPDGAPIRETVWVNYYVTGGELDRDIQLVSDASGQLRSGDELSVTWIPPAAPGSYEVFAVLRDTRGGSSVTRRRVLVE